MPFNEVIVLPSLLEKLKRGGYENMDQLVAKKSTELKAGNVKFMLRSLTIYFTKCCALSFVELNLEYEEVKQLIEARNLGEEHINLITLSFSNPFFISL